jgi:hypothetical protein
MKKFDYSLDYDDDSLFEPRKRTGGKLKKMRDVEKARENKKEKGRFRKRN